MQRNEGLCSATIMAADLAREPHSGLLVQLCGDAHVQNLGSFAAPDGRLVFHINDFDETILGPWEWDVKRMAASIVSGWPRSGSPAFSLRWGGLGLRHELLQVAREPGRATDLGCGSPSADPPCKKSSGRWRSLAAGTARECLRSIEEVHRERYARARPFQENRSRDLEIDRPAPVRDPRWATSV